MMVSACLHSRDGEVVADLEVPTPDVSPGEGPPPDEERLPGVVVLGQRAFAYSGQDDGRALYREVEPFTGGRPGGRVYRVPA